jgi:hypothetical protein
MNKWKGLAILFSLLSFGAVQETYRIFTSDAPDIVRNRTELMPFASIMTVVFIFLAIRFWNKSGKKDL